jgi:hypothetical protein
MDDEVVVGGRNRYWYGQLTDEEIFGSLPEPPSFPEDIALVRDRVRKIIGKVSVGKVMTVRHPAVARLMPKPSAVRTSYALPFSPDTGAIRSGRPGRTGKGAASSVSFRRSPWKWSRRPAKAVSTHLSGASDAKHSSRRMLGIANCKSNAKSENASNNSSRPGSIGCSMKPRRWASDGHPSLR